MKIRIAALLAALFMVVPPASMQAQQFDGVGVKAGINAASFVVSDLDGALSVRPGLAVGGFFSYRFTRHFAVQPEILFTMKGARFAPDDASTFPGDVTFKLNYLELPLLARFALPAFGDFTPSLFAGPALAFKLTASLEVTAGGQSADAAFGEVVDPLDTSGVAGLGLAYDLAAGAFLVEARYTLGLTNLDEDEVFFVDTRNGVFSFLVGFSF